MYLLLFYFISSRLSTMIVFKGLFLSLDNYFNILVVLIWIF